MINLARGLQIARPGFMESKLVEIVTEGERAKQEPSTASSTFWGGHGIVVLAQTLALEHPQFLLSI